MPRRKVEKKLADQEPVEPEVDQSQNQKEEVKEIKPETQTTAIGEAEEQKGELGDQPAEEDSQEQKDQIENTEGKEDFSGLRTLVRKNPRTKKSKSSSPNARTGLKGVRAKRVRMAPKAGLIQPADGSHSSPPQPSQYSLRSGMRGGGGRETTNLATDVIAH